MFPLEAAMNRCSFRSAVLALALLALLETGYAQKGGGASSGRTSIPSRTTNTAPDTNTQPLFISGRVIMEGGGPLPEPVAIERVCNGAARREGYTDFKGHFQLQLGGQNFNFQDASENGSSTPSSLSPVRTTSLTSKGKPLDLTGCEFKAVLPGFQSSILQIRSYVDTFQMDIGTIVLKRMGDVNGATISSTTMAAPNNARQAFEKARKAAQGKKLEEAEKQLHKAVEIYPNFAAAWSLLGDVEQQQQKLEEARSAYTESMAADPKYVNPAFGMTLIAIQEKKWEEAAKFSAQVTSLNAYAFPAAYYYNAAANYNAGNMAAAEASGRKFKSIDNEHKHPEVSLLLSQILSRKQDYAGAAQQIRDFLLLVPAAPNAAELQAQAKSFEELSVAKKQ